MKVRIGLKTICQSTRTWLDNLVGQKIIFWLTLTVSALFFGSCIKDDGQAFEAPSGLQTAGTEYIDTFSISTETFRMDSLLTSGREYVLAGTYTDGVLGKMSAEGYFQFLPESYPQVCPDSILDEYTRAIIILNNDKTYGKFGKDQFGLYRLTENLDGDRSHYSGETAPLHEAQPYINTLNASRTETSIRIDANQLGREIISFWKEKKTLTDDKQFLEKWKGFALKSLDSVPQVSRFDLQYNAESSPAFLQIFYRVKRGNEQPEEKSLRFRTNKTTVQYYSLLPDFNGTPWAGIPAGEGLPASLSNGIAAIQGGSGLAVKLKMPGLMAWKQSLNRKVKIFKAELEIKPQDPSSLATPEFIRITCRDDYQNPNETDLAQNVLNETNVFALFQQGYPSREIAATALASRLFAYEPTGNMYRCNITGHIQDLLDGKKTNTSLNIYGSQWTISVNRMLLPANSVKLKLYYFPF